MCVLESRWKGSKARSIRWIQTVPPWGRSAVEGKSARQDQEFEAGKGRSDVESSSYVFLSDRGYQKKE